MRNSFRVPSYRLHKASGQGVVVLNGHSFYLGKYGSSASKSAYKRVVAEWLANNRNPPAEVLTGGKESGAALTVNELILAYWHFAEAYYVKNGSPTSEQGA